MERTTSMSFKLVNVQHRHCVFTINENLRDSFSNDRSLLNCLFHSVTSIISHMFYKMNKSKNFTPGFIMVLHTFGRDLKWNPHIHYLLSEGGFSDDGFWRNVKYFNYTCLRNAFRTALLNELESRTGPSSPLPELITMTVCTQDIGELRKKYIDNPPEGMPSKDIRRMSEEELPDMDYSLNEDDLFADEAGIEGFYIF